MGVRVARGAGGDACGPSFRGRRTTGVRVARGAGEDACGPSFVNFSRAVPYK